MGLRIKLSWGCGSDRVLTYQAGGPEFHRQHQRKPARTAVWLFTLDLGDQGRMEWESIMAAGAQDCIKGATFENVKVRSVPLRPLEAAPRPGPQRSLD